MAWKFIQEQHWMKRRKNTGERIEVTEEEYSSVVIPVAKRIKKEGMISGTIENEILCQRIKEYATVSDFFFSTPEEVEELKANILASFWGDCIEQAEEKTGYFLITTGHYKDE